MSSKISDTWWKKLIAFCIGFGAIWGFLVQIGEPALEDYVDYRIELRHEEELKNKKESFRKLLGKALDVDADEVTFILRDVINDNKKVKKEIRWFHPSNQLDK